MNNVTKQFATIAIKTQKKFIVDCAMRLHKILIDSYGDKETYREMEIEAGLKECGYSVKRNAVTKLKSDPMIAHLMFMDVDSFLHQYRDCEYSLVEYIKYRDVIANVLFKGMTSLVKTDNPAALVSSTGLKLIYRAKMFCIEQPIYSDQMDSTTELGEETKDLIIAESFDADCETVTAKTPTSDSDRIEMPIKVVDLK